MANDSLGNEIVCLRNRVLMAVPPPTGISSPEFRRVGREVQRAVSAAVGTLRPLASLRVQDIMVKRHGSRRYGNVCASLASSPLTPLDARLKSFIKLEKAFSPLQDTALKTPRAIQYRGSRYNLMLGKYLVPFEEVFYEKFRNINSSGMHTSKGLTLRARAQLLADLWAETPGCVAYSVDASRFDAHVSVEMLGWEHSTYQQAFPGVRLLKWLLGLQLHNTGVGKWGSKYSLRGGRMSGDMNTACGNTLVNFFLLSYIVRDIPGAKFVCEGDDAVIFMPQRSARANMLDTVKARGLELGFKLKCSRAETLDQVEYCSGRVLEHGGGVYSHLREWPKPLVTDMWTTKMLGSEADLGAHRLAMAMSAFVMYRGQPVYGAWAQYLLSHAPRVRLRKDLLDKWQVDRLLLEATEGGLLPAEVKVEARACFQALTGVGPTEQHQLESLLLSQRGPWPAAADHRIREEVEKLCPLR